MKALRLRTQNLILDSIQKVVQILALICAGIWVSFSFFAYQAKTAKLDDLIKQAEINVRRQQLEYEAQHKASSDVKTTMELIKKVDARRNLYLVTIDYTIRNETERRINFSYAGMECYLGKRISEESIGYVQIPGSNIDSPTLRWDRFGTYLDIEKGFKEAAMSELIDPHAFFVITTRQGAHIPHKQTKSNIARFIVIASPTEWIGVRTFCKLDAGTPIEDRMSGFSLQTFTSQPKTEQRRETAAQ